MLKLFAKWCLRARYLPEDPLVAVATPRIPRWRPKPLPDPIVPRILAAAGKTKEALAEGDRALALAQTAEPKADENATAPFRKLMAESRTLF